MSTQSHNPTYIAEVADNLAKVQSFDPWSAKWISEAHMLLRSIASQPAEQPRGEPIAWQYRVTRDGGSYVDWQPWDREDRPKMIGRWKAEYRPLYAAQPKPEQHPDDVAVDAFAAALKAKLAEARSKGRAGWNNDEPGMQQRLSNMLRAHVEKGDPRDVANFAMFLHQRGESILPGIEALDQPKPEQAVGGGVTVWMIRSNTGVVHWDETGYVFPDEESAQQEARLMTDADPDGQSFGAFPLSYVPRPAPVEVGGGVESAKMLADALAEITATRYDDDPSSETYDADGHSRCVDIADAALLRYEQTITTPRPAVATPAEVTEDVVRGAHDRYLEVVREGVALGVSHVSESNQHEAMRAALLFSRAALASPSAGAVVPDRKLLRAVVDKAWQEATESEQVPATEWADRIIDQVLAAAPEVDHG